MSDKLKPISTAPKNKWVLLAGDSGYSTTPLRFTAGKWSADKECWVDHSNEPFSHGGGEPEYWMEIPQAEIEKKSAYEWLQTEEYKGIAIINPTFSLIVPITKREFEGKLLTCRVEISEDKLKELLNKK